MSEPHVVIARQLEQVFQHILQHRMNDVPVLNDKLSVKAIGFQTWQQQIIGVLITPWFMNMLLLTGEEGLEQWQGLRVGQEISHTLPSGHYTFVVGFESKLGFYQSCSLFSPMFEFENQQAAEATAEQVMLALFDQKNEDIESQHPARDIEKIWHGEQVAPEVDVDQALSIQAKPSGQPDSPTQRIKPQLSRRDFLRGRLSENCTDTDGSAEP